MDDFQDNADIPFSADCAASLGTGQAPEKERRHPDQAEKVNTGIPPFNE